MKILNLTFGLLFLLCGFNTIAQDNFLIDQYIFNQQFFNPATIGQNSDFGIYLYGDKNFINSTDTPYKYFLSGYKSFKNNNLDIGLSFMQDKYFKEKATYLLGDIAYGFNFDSGKQLKIGIKSGWFNYTNPLTEYQLYPDGIYDYAFAKNINDNFLLVGLGIFFSSEKFKVGISSPQIVKSGIYNNNNESIINNNLFIFSEYKFELNEKIVLLPNFLFNYKETLPNSYLTSLTLEYNNKVSFGSSFNYRNSLILYSRWVFNNGIGIGYSYKFLTNKIGDRFLNKHGVSLSYEL